MASSFCFVFSYLWILKKYALFQTILFFGKCDQTLNITSGVCRITGTALNNT